MQLSEIFERKIDRVINSAVVVSNQKKDTVQAEITEYVFTSDLIEKLYYFLDISVFRISKNDCYMSYKM